MQIVIDIEEGRYKWIMSHASNHPYDYANTTDIVFRKAVESGIVLPKGYGRLIDADAFIMGLDEYNEYATFDCNAVKDLVGEAPTVIPADKGE